MSVMPVVPDEPIQRFWEAFASAHISDCQSEDSKSPVGHLPDALFVALQKVSAELSAEFEYDDDVEKPPLFVITPNTSPQIRPLINAMIDRAPEMLGIELSEYRRPKPFTVVSEWWSANCPKCEFPSTCKVKSVEHHGIAIEFVIDNVCENSFINTRGILTNAVRLLLGDEYFEQWISFVNVVYERPKNRSEEAEEVRGSSLIWEASPHELFDVVVNSIQSILKAIPEHWLMDYWDLETVDPALSAPGDSTSSGNNEHEMGTVFELFPVESSSYPAFSDMVVAYSQFDDLWLAEHSAEKFYSSRFSKHGQLFCYLKIDGRQGLAGSRFTDRGEIEDAISEALLDTSSGLVTGGATGLHYSYIDLVLSDITVGLASIRALLSRARIHTRCWVEFFDFDLKGLWIPMGERMPPPPGHEIPIF